MYKDILLPVDLTHNNDSRKSIDAAVEYAQAFDSRLHVMTVVPDSGMSMISQYFNKDDVQKLLMQQMKNFINLPRKIFRIH